MNFGRIIALIGKEFMAVLRDPRSRFVLIGPPLVQLFIFAFAATQEVENVTIAILNEDRGSAAAELVQRIDGSPTFTRILALYRASALRQAVDRREALVALRIGPDFSRRIEDGRAADLQVILDGRRSNAAQIVQGYIARIVDQMNEEFAGAALSPDTALVTRTFYNPNKDYQWFIVPGLAGVLPMLIALIVTSLSVARERELGTFEQLLVSPLMPSEILIGKSLPALVIGTVEGGIMVLAAIFIFGVPFTGSIGLLAAAMPLFLLAVIGVGLFISSLSLTQQQAILGSFLFMVPAVTLSGFATPVENMPGWLQLATEADPLKHFLIVVRGLFMKDLPADEAWSHLWKLGPIAFATLGAAAWLFRRRMA